MANTEDTLSKDTTESHPLRPFLPQGAKLLMCGTFPPQRHRWSMNFYYPNFINDMWRIFGLILEGDKDYFVDAPAKTFKVNLLKETLTNLGVALSDTGREIVRTAGNAADKFLDIRKQIDLPAMLTELPDCIAVATTGEKAASVIAEMTGTEIPKMGEYRECELLDSAGNLRKFHHWRMPSSSRAYPMKVEDKAAIYGKMISEVFGIITKLPGRNDNSAC
ncbi:MAG: uracil-DNA glycosylase family protein [Muribaculaceae bacterium]|nr:uracil-DNA glycosylase family protein [Muribaculaceae bacterium]